MDNKGLSVAAMVLGIVSIIFMWEFTISISCGVLAIVFGVMQMKKGQDKMAKAGFITGIIGVSIPVVMLVIGWLGIFTIFSLLF